MTPMHLNPNVNFTFIIYSLRSNALVTKAVIVFAPLEPRICNLPRASVVFSGMCHPRETYAGEIAVGI